jgi:mannose-6-phosphate isomerase-like protein (cupin superfamily)
MVALLNYEPIMDLDKAIEIERHVKTDEVFILLEGMAALYLVAGDKPLQVIELKPGMIYNVIKGTWHNLLATKEAQFVIVENRDTDKFDTEIRPLANEERQFMLGQLPGWVK